jgi:hypothetical protein
MIMKYSLRLVIGLSVLIMISACSLSYESKGDAAYNKAQNTSDANAKRILQKSAYIKYQQAVRAHPDKISPRLRERYIEMILQRAGMVLSEGTASMDAIPLYIADIDTMMKPEVPQNLKDTYAAFLLNLADSTVAREKMDDALLLIDKALGLASDGTAGKNKKEAIVGSFVKSKFEEASTIFEESKKSKDVNGIVSSEYLTLVVMKYKPDYPGAAALLSTIRQGNLNTYSAYKRVIEGKPDPAVDKYDILLAIPSVVSKGGTVTLQVGMWNNSYNPLRMRARNFFLVDAAGTKYPAMESSKIDPEILDTERETTTLVLRFPVPKEKIAKLLYENEEHVSEKFFY